jgi:hypothetical protein
VEKKNIKYSDRVPLFYFPAIRNENDIPLSLMKLLPPMMSIFFFFARDKNHKAHRM